MPFLNNPLPLLCSVLPSSKDCGIEHDVHLSPTQTPVFSPGSYLSYLSNIVLISAVSPEDAVCQALGLGFSSLPKTRVLQALIYAPYSVLWDC